MLNKTTKVVYRYSFPVIISIAFLCCVSTIAIAQTTAFNFQGRLNDGSNPANGKYDLEFRLYDGLTGDIQIGAANSKQNLTLINGVFSTQLDFGLTAFNGANRFVEIRLRQTATGNNPPNAFVILGPRQQILSVPYTIRSLKATNADNAIHADTAANADNATHALDSDTSGLANYAKNALDASNLGGFPANQFIREGSFLLPKIILRLDRDGNIVRCYNGVTKASTGNCGFTVTHTQSGHYLVKPGFLISDLIINATSEVDYGFTYCVLWKIDQNELDVVVFYQSDDSTTNAPINIVAY